MHAPSQILRASATPCLFAGHIDTDSNATGEILSKSGDNIEARSNTDLPWLPTLTSRPRAYDK